MKKLPLIAIASVALSTTAFAEEPARFGVFKIDGPTANEISSSIEQSLRGKLEAKLVPRSRLRQIAGHLSVELDSSDGTQAVANYLQLAAQIQGKVVRSGNQWQAQMRVIYTDNGKQAAQFTASAAQITQLDNVVSSQIWAEFKDALIRAPRPKPQRKIGLIATSGPQSGVKAVRKELSRQSWLTLMDTKTPRNLKSSATARQRVAKKYDLHGFATIKVSRRRGKWRGTIQVFDGKDGSEKESISASARRTRGLAQKLRRQAENAFSSLEGQMAPPPPPPAPEPVAQAAPPPPPAAAQVSEPAEPDRPRNGPSPLQIGAEARLMTRSLSYNDDLFGGLRPYDLAGAPVLRIHGAWFPGAHVTDGFAANIGLHFSGDLAFALGSQDSAGRDYPTDAYAVVGGLLARFPLGAHQLNISLGGGLEHFAINEADDGTDANLAPADYTFLRAGLGGRIQIIDGLNVAVQGGFRQVLSMGDLGSRLWFPNASMAGLDAELKLGYQLSSSLEISLGGEMRRYFASFSPNPGDFPVAGGAVDQFLSGSLGLTYSM